MPDLPLRRATPADAATLAAIVAAIWPDTPADPAQIRRALAAPGAAALVVTAADRPVAFVSGFLTQDGAGRPRWEVDLLAVLPAFQGQGVGLRLIELSSSLGLALGGSLRRGLVSLNNGASQRAFARAGYRPARQPAGLFIAPPAPATLRATLPAGAPLIPVTTFTYTGLWLENNHTRAALLAARAAGAALGVARIGAVIPDADTPAQAAARAAGYEEKGCFDWWEKERGMGK